jgi:radical SAM superfamily enzyme YgiQ (UPF0313 family)
MWMKLIYPKWPKLPEQTEFHLPPHGPINFAANVPGDIELTFHDENRVELDLEDNPDVVALSVMLTCATPRAKEIAAAYRARGIPVIAGGIAVAIHKEEMAEACDAVFLGEVEGHFDEVLDDLRRKQLKKVYDRMAQLPDIGAVKTARRDILDYDLYTYRGVRMVDLVHASRGCRFNCPPCSVAYLGGRCFRPRPVEDVVREVESIDNGRLFFVDNSLAQSKAWELELFKALKPLKRKWISHPIEADDDVLHAAYEAGAWYVYQAITQPSDGIRKRIQMYRDHGIGIEGTIILGADDQTKDDVVRLVEFCLEMDLDMAEFTVMTPFLHTPYRTQVEAEGRVLHNNWIDYTTGKVVFQPKHMTPTELQDLYYWAWDRFYGADGRQTKMARLFRKVVLRERAEGVQVLGDGTLRGWVKPDPETTTGS